MAGNREKSWKKNKRFREGQSEQILSDLFFDFIDVAERLQPKIIMAENVKGMLLGNAKIYTKEIVKRLEKIGYKVQIFLFNAASMGVPQKRERIFFICQRKDLNLPKLKLKFNEKPIIYEKIKTNENTRPVTAPSCLKVWEKRKKGEKSLADTNKRIFGKTDFFNIYYIYENEVLKTITAADKNILFNEPRCLNKTELCLASSFPLDYDFGENKIEYVVGMSVPPVMMAQIANQIYEQWLSKLEI
jgi:DNA (cytosine-5)-methyltransferase 1